MIPTAWYINCAGPELTGDGATWTSSEQAPIRIIHGNTSPREAVVPVYGSQIPELYRSVYTSDRTADIPLALQLDLPAGHYRVECYWAETSDIPHAIERRCFDVSANNTLLYQGIKPKHDAGGYGCRLRLVASCQVEDDGLRIDMHGESPFLAAIAVIPDASEHEARLEALSEPPPNDGIYGIHVPMGAHDRRLRTLFIGNSGTFFWGVPHSVQHLLECWGGSQRLEPSESLAGGRTLHWHWHEGDARARIEAQPWDLVVLQEGTGASKSEQAWREAEEVASLFADIVRHHNATPIYYSSYLHQSANDEERREFGERSYTLATSLDMPAVIGSEVLRQLIVTAPDLQSHSCDTVHLASSGAYGIAINLAALIADRSPLDHPAPSVLGGLVPIPEARARIIERSVEASMQRYPSRLQG